MILTSVKIWETIFFEKIKKSLNSIVWKFEKFRKNKKNPKIPELHGYECPDFFFFLNPKILEFNCVKVRKFQEIKKNPKILDLHKSENLEKKIPFEKIQKSLNSSCVKVWKFQKIKKSKNPWSLQVWKSGKDILFWKNPKILDSERCYNLWTKKIVQRKNPKILEFDANSDIVQFLNKSKNPWIWKV